MASSWSSIWVKRSARYDGFDAELSQSSDKMEQKMASDEEDYEKKIQEGVDESKSKEDEMVTLLAEVESAPPRQKQFHRSGAAR